MSLLLKALKQAERQNREASLPAEALDIDLPAKEAPATKAPAAAQPEPVESALSLTPDEQPDKAPSFPSLHAPEPKAESSLSFAVDDPALEAFPRHASAEEPRDDSAAAAKSPDIEQSNAPEGITAVENPAPYLQPGEAGLLLSRSPVKRLRLAGLAIAGVAIGAAVWWAVFEKPKAQFEAPALATPITTLPTAETASEQTVQAKIAEPTSLQKPASQTTQAPGKAGGDAKPSGTAKPTSGAATSRPAKTKTARPVRKKLNTKRADLQPTTPPVRFVRGVRPGKSWQSLLNDGYRSLREGNYSQARTAYQTALRQDRNLIDGWVGLASVATHEGNRELALEHYQRALNLDPSDPAARSGLIALHGSHLGQQGESALRTLLSTADDNPTALLALANRLAGQGRWREAQQAYFTANTVQPDRPDTLFNLAVSLEQIHQPAAAIQYYERALKLANSRPYQFDQTIARKRIEALGSAKEQSVERQH